MNHYTRLGRVTARFYETEGDLQQMQALLMEARSRTEDWRYPHIGEFTFRFFMVACHLDAGEHVRLWHDDQGKLVAYAMLGDDPSFDCQVLPEYAWCGIEAQALDWAETRVDQLRQRDAERWGGSLVSGARQDDTRRVAFLEQHGFRYRGEFSEANMLRSLDEPVPTAPLPAGCQVRALASDADEIADRVAAYREVWLPWTDGDVSTADYARFRRLPGYHPDMDIVAVAPDGAVAALANGWIDPHNRIGEFGSVSARPAYRRQGLTRAVLIEGLRRFKARGVERVSVSTGVSNTPALRLYESVGFKVVNRYLDYVK